MYEADKLNIDDMKTDEGHQPNQMSKADELELNDLGSSIKQKLSELNFFKEKLVVAQNLKEKFEAEHTIKRR